MPLPYVAQAHSRSDTKAGADRPRVSSEERKEPMTAKRRSLDRDPRAIFRESYPDRFPESLSDCASTPIDVKTPEGSIKLHFPPDALADIKKGDRVTVELGIKDKGP